jgi:glycosyltransferase involved in cell wall biosynthesis
VSDDLAAALAVSPGDPFGRALGEKLRAGADGIVLSHPFLVRQAVAAAPGVPIVYDSHNVEADLKEAMYGDDPGGRQAAQLVADLEAEACERARLIVCCTEEDRRRLQERFGVPADRIHVIPNGVALDDAIHTPWAHRAARPPRCVFAGSAHGPNVEAAAVIAAAAARLPEVGFDLVGDVGGGLPAGALPPNVVAHGRISDVEKQRLFRDATLALNPMRTGSGSNLKVADYAGAGLPVITSATGARGFGRDLVGCFTVCEPEPAALAAATGAALGEDWAARTERARAIVEAEYDWRTLARRYADLLHAALRP